MPVNRFPSCQPRQWMGSVAEASAADWWLVGLPYDGTTSYRPGTRFGPAAAREASWGTETYSPAWDLDLEACLSFYDKGDLELPIGNRQACLDVMRDAAQATLSAGKKWMGIGGEHLVTYPVIQAYVERYPDLAILHFDAHADLRDDFLGEALSHATVLRRCVELITPERYAQIGIRSGTQAEWRWMREHRTLFSPFEEHEIQRLKARLAGRPVFLTLDLDALDPSVLPGTGTPEPGGLSYQALYNWLQAVCPINLVGADVVELSPHYDASGVSNVVAAKLVRDIFMLASHSPATQGAQDSVVTS